MLETLHGGNGAASAALDAALAQTAAVEAEDGVDERAAHGAAELAFVGEPCPELERKRVHSLAQRRVGRQDVLDEIGGGGGHAPPEARWASAAFAREPDHESLAAARRTSDAQLVASNR